MIVACGSAETHLRWSSLGKPGGPTPEKSGGPLRRKSGGPQSGNSALLKWIPPILIEATVVEVSFQTEHLGWKADDVLITCEGAGGIRSKLAGQVKRTFTVSAADEECQKAILDFWQDFKGSLQKTENKAR
ncbi:MAG: hypothetical protein ACYCUI_12240 [Vulcanimicrobiaceae bacterium]